MTEPDPRLQMARLIDLLDELLTIEARMAGLGARGAAVRGELNRRGDETYDRDGMAPTWRAPEKLGSISYSAGKDSVVVTDPADWASWVAEHFPDEVTATITVPARLLETVLELIRQYRVGMLADVQTALTVRDNWQKVFLSKHTTVIERDQICNSAGEIIPGIGQRHTGRTGVSVRVNPEAKERAIAELSDPAALAVLTSPIGQVAHPAAAADLVDVADGEPTYEDVPMDEDARRTARALAELHVAFSMNSTVPQMRAWCRQLGLPTTGRKADLYERLQARLPQPVGASA